MPRTAISVYDTPGFKDTNGTTVVATAGDSANNHSAAFNAKGIIIVAEASGSVTITIDSTPDPNFGREGDHSLAMTTGQVAIFGPFYRGGFVQSDGTLHIDVSSDDIELYGIRV